MKAPEMGSTEYRKVYGRRMTEDTFRAAVASLKPP